jgi:hypothetical protein
MEHTAMFTKSRCRRLPSPGGPGPAGHIRLYDQEGLELRRVGLGQATLQGPGPFAPLVDLGSFPCDLGAE